MIKVCQYSDCHRTARFLMGWKNKDGKHFGLVCATCDKKLGRTNLLKTGMPIYKCRLFDRYTAQTVNDPNPIDWPEWLKLRGLK